MQNIANNDENNELTGMAQHDIACGQRSEVGHKVVGVEVDTSFLFLYLLAVGGKIDNC